MHSRFLLTNGRTSAVERGWGFVVFFGKGQEYGSVLLLLSFNQSNVGKEVLKRKGKVGGGGVADVKVNISCSKGNLE